MKQFKPTSPVQEKLGRILVLSDAAHSIGAYYRNGEHVGAETDIAIFSLHAVKNVTTAEGGAICINMPAPFDNAALYTQLRQMSLNCQTKDAFSKSQAGAWRYDITALGMKINMADVNAAIGLAQIREYPKLLKERKRVFDIYAHHFTDKPWAIVPPERQGDRLTSYHLYALRIKGITEAQRDEIINRIAQREVAVNVHFMPLPLLTLYRDLGYRIEDYPVAYANYASEISLPIYPQLTDEMATFVAEAVIAAYGEVVG